MTRLLALGLVACALLGITPAPADTKAAPAADVRAVAAGGNDFAFDLARQMKGDNVFFSPLSVSTALSMTYAGARKETASEMSKTLHYPFDGDRLHLANAGLLGKMAGEAKPAGVKLSVANALWGKEECKPEFLKINRERYAAQVKKLDLVGAEPVINKWAEDNTGGRIKDLLAPGTLTEKHVLVLTNAVYFKGEWAARFDPKATAKQPFRQGEGKRVQVEMMRQTAKLSIGTLDAKGPGEAQVLALPYKGGDVSMLVVLPTKDDGLAKTEAALTAAKLEEVLKASRERVVQLSLPRFKIAGGTVKLKEPLIALGMKDAFSARKANFSGMFVESKLDPFIDDVLHKAFVEVNEEGAEAAAATAVLMTTKSKPKVATFNADHPFLFLIRDNRTGCILFLGRLTKPA